MDDAGQTRLGGGGRRCSAAEAEEAGWRELEERDRSSPAEWPAWVAERGGFFLDFNGNFSVACGDGDL